MNLGISPRANFCDEKRCHRKNLVTGTEIGYLIYYISQTNYVDLFSTASLLSCCLLL